MAKKKDPVKLPDLKQEGPVDLLEMPVEDAKATQQAYTVEAGGRTVELTLDQLLELATRCIEADLAGSGEESELSDVPDLLEFVKQYPDVREFPEPVAELIRQGKSPVEAYRAYENEDLRNKLRAMEQNAANQKTSLGSARGEAGDDDDLGEIMAIFNSVFQ